MCECVDEAGPMKMQCARREVGGGGGGGSQAPIGQRHEKLRVGRESLYRCGSVVVKVLVVSRFKGREREREKFGWVG